MTETGNEKSTGFWRTSWKRYKRSRIGMLAFFFLIALAAVAFFAPMLANDIPIICSIEYPRPGGETGGPARLIVASKTASSGRPGRRARKKAYAASARLLLAAKKFPED